MNKKFELKLDQAAAQHRAGRPDLAEPVYRELFEENPGSPELNHLLGVIELTKDRYAEAEVFIAQAIRRDATQAKYHNTLGAVLRKAGRKQEAIEAYQKALQVEPDFIDARHNLADVYLGMGKSQKAEHCIEKILDIEPDNIDALNNLAALNMTNDRHDTALDLLRHAVELAPDNGMVLTNLLKCLERKNLLAEASEVAFRLEAAGPDHVEGRLFAARIERRTGRENQAVASLRRLIKDTVNTKIHYHALFELGLVLDRIGQPEDAFDIFGQANALQKQRLPATVDAARYRSQIARDRNWLIPERFKIWEDSIGEDTPAPVFLVGFPRSGVTLFEQVLRAHPDIVTTGEASPLERLRNHIHQEGNYPECLNTASGQDIKKWQRLYQDYCHDILTGPLDDRVMIDTMPLNITEIGLINRILPRARIITAVRDPRDVCLSCFMQNFQPGDTLSYFNDLHTTAQLYVQIMEFWQHCRQHMALPCIEFRYEDLIADFEATTRNVLDFLDVPWSDDIIRYRDGVLARKITSASLRDVVNPMYTDAAGRWLRYQQHLEPVLELLEPYIGEFGYDAR